MSKNTTPLQNQHPDRLELRGLELLPQPAISQELAKVIHLLYGLQWIPRVVRQTRELKVGALPFIDYAVPCFELAKLLKTDVQTVAEQIATACKSSLMQYDSMHPLHGAGLEAVGGYVNVYISNASLTRSIRLAERWYTRPYLATRQRPMDEILMLGNKSWDNYDGNITVSAYNLVDDVYDLLGKRHNATELVSDFSEHAMEELTALIAGEYARQNGPSTLNMMRAEREVREYFSNPAAAHHIHQKWEQAREQWLPQHQRQVDVLFESDHHVQAHEYFDTLTSKTAAKKGIIYDNATKALYYSDTIDTVPLRSTRGVVYSSAYLLVVLRDIVQKIKTSQSKTLVVIAPQRLHYLIHTYVRLSVRSPHVPERVICFDPKTARADIVALQTDIVSLEDHFDQMGDAVRTGADNLSISRRRQALLLLIDFPVDLTYAVSKVQMPLLFDLLHQSVDALAILKR